MPFGQAEQQVRCASCVFRASAELIFFLLRQVAYTPFYVPPGAPPAPTQTPSPSTQPSGGGGGSNAGAVAGGLVQRTTPGISCHLVELCVSGGVIAAIAILGGAAGAFIWWRKRNAGGRYSAYAPYAASGSASAFATPSFTSSLNADGGGGGVASGGGGEGTYAAL
jgi:hypothetical protein